MITVNCKQRTDAWHLARLGIPTASRFADIITPDGKRRKGKGPSSYLSELVAERLWGQQQDRFESFWMQRGVALEPHARAWYELATGRTVKTVGFVYGDESRQWGCSPDGIIPDDCGGLEIKCPKSGALIANMVGTLDEDYIMQAQAEMWICGAAWWDVVIYDEHDDEPAGHILRVPKDAKLHDAFSEIIPAFAAEVAFKASVAADLLAQRKRITMAAIADRLGPEWARFTPDNGGNVDMEGLTNE